MVAAVAVWHGTSDQQFALLTALEHNCTCDEVPRTCPAHQAMFSQRFLDGLLFARYLGEQLLDEEFMVS